MFNMRILTWWCFGMGGRFVDLVGSLIGFELHGIEHEANQNVVNSINNGTFWTGYVFNNLAFSWNFCLLLALFDYGYHRSTTKWKRQFLILSAYIFGAYFALGYLMGICWLLASFFGEPVMNALAVPVFLLIIECYFYLFFEVNQVWRMRVREGCTFFFQWKAMSEIKEEIT